MALGKSGSKNNRIAWALFGAISWALWITRNDLVFNRKVCSSPLVNLHKVISFFSQWKVLLPEKLKKGRDDLVEKLMLAAKNLQLLSFSRIGVG